MVKWISVLLTKSGGDGRRAEQGLERKQYSLLLPSRTDNSAGQKGGAGLNVVGSEEEKSVRNKEHIETFVLL